MDSSTLTSRGHHSGAPSPKEVAVDPPFGGDDANAKPLALPSPVKQTAAGRRLGGRVAVPLIVALLIGLAVLVARSNSLATTEPPRDEWARVAHGGSSAGRRPASASSSAGAASASVVATSDGATQPASSAVALASPSMRAPSAPVPRPLASACVSVRTCLRNENPDVKKFGCWEVERYVELTDLHSEGMSEYERCLWRTDSLSSAKRACEQAQSWCKGIVRDNGIYCSVRGRTRKMVYELRRGGAMRHPERVTWIPQRNASQPCASAYESVEEPPQQQEPSSSSWSGGDSAEQQTPSNAWSSRTDADGGSVTSGWWSTYAAREARPPPPPPPPPPPLPPLPPELQLGEVPAYGTPGGTLAPDVGAEAALLRRGARPNVVVMNVDDTGYGDYGFNNPNTDDTPHLDRLRTRGMRFSDLHAGASVCTPSRASLVTGRLGVRTGVTGNFMPYSIGGLTHGEITIAALLKRHGYVTGMAGKWHLGHRASYLPRAHGFDAFFGLGMSHDYGCTDHPGPSTNCANWQANVCDAPDTVSDGPECELSPRNPWGSSVPLYADETIVEQPVDHRTLHHRYADWVEGFVRTTQAAPAPTRKPFFLYVAFSHLHTPIVYNFSNFPPGESSPRGHYGNAVRELDETVGRMYGVLEALRIERQTLLLFTGDNGGGDPQCEFGGNNAPFVGVWQREHGGGGSTGKTSTWEGGHREPGLAVWPGHIGAGATSHALVSQLDFLPTIAALAGAPLPEARTYDGVDLSRLLFANDSAYLRRRILVHPNSGEGPMGGLDTVRVGRYKAKFRTGGIATECPTAREGFRKAPLMYHDPPLLFDLAADPAERNNLQPRQQYYGAVLRVLLEARAVVAASVAADELSSYVDWSEDTSVRACCDPSKHMCRCDAVAAAFPSTAGVEISPTRPTYSKRGRRRRSWFSESDADSAASDASAASPPAASAASATPAASATSAASAAFASSSVASAASDTSSVASAASPRAAFLAAAAEAAVAAPATSATASSDPSVALSSSAAAAAAAAPVAAAAAPAVAAAAPQAAVATVPTTSAPAPAAAVAAAPIAGAVATVTAPVATAVPVAVAAPAVAAAADPAAATAPPVATAVASAVPAATATAPDATAASLPVVATATPVVATAVPVTAATAPPVAVAVAVPAMAMAVPVAAAPAAAVAVPATAVPVTAATAPAIAATAARAAAPVATGVATVVATPTTTVAAPATAAVATSMSAAPAAVVATATAVTAAPASTAPVLPVATAFSTAAPTATVASAPVTATVPVPAVATATPIAPAAVATTPVTAAVSSQQVTVDRVKGLVRRGSAQLMTRFPRATSPPPPLPAASAEAATPAAATPAAATAASAVSAALPAAAEAPAALPRSALPSAVKDKYRNSELFTNTSTARRSSMTLRDAVSKIRDGISSRRTSEPTAV